jgi:hypothetical protein
LHTQLLTDAAKAFTDVKNKKDTGEIIEW